MPTFPVAPTLRVLSVAVLGLLVLAAPAAASERTFTWTATGQEQTVTVPAGVTSVDVVAVGGQGGSASPSLWPGGYGARVTGTIAVTPGQTLYLEVGGNGAGQGGVAAFNGGAAGGQYSSGGGGGATDVRVCPRAVSTCLGADDPLGRVLVAGGGGGGTLDNGGLGSAGGTAGATATDGGQATYWSRGTAYGGGGATPTAGGAAGSPGGTGAAGSGTLGAGGKGADTNISAYAGGGGGGGGVYGGGGGGNVDGFYGGGGGAGSSLAPSGGTVTTDATARPRIELTFAAGPADQVSAPVLSRTDVYADGTSTATATVTVTGNGLPYSGEPVTFTASGPAPTIGPVTDHGDGSYSVTLTASSTAGVSQLRAHDADATAADGPTTDFTQHRAAQVTSPADGTPVLDAATGGGTVSVSGTADPYTTQVNLWCRDSGNDTPLGGAGQHVPVTNGTWTATDAPLPDGVSDTTSCRLVASPSGLAPNGDSTGPFLRRLALLTTPSLAGGLHTASYAATGTDARIDATPLGQSPCGFQLATLGDSGTQILACANGLTGAADWAAPTQAALTVDGQRAWTAGQANDDATAPSFTLSRSVAADGSLFWTETDTTAFCPGPASCPPYTGTGVAITVRTSVSPSGLLIKRLYTLRSTDGRSHTVHLAMGIRTAYAAPRYRIGAETDYTARTTGTTVPVPAGPLVIRARDNSYPNSPYATFTMAEAPDALQTASYSRIVQRYDRTVPATGSVALGFTAEVTDPTDGATDAAAARGLASYAPAPTITAPDPDSTTTAATTTVTGTVRPGSTVTVNGAAVSPSDDGRWTTQVPLTVGANTLTAVETTAFGQTASASVAVTRVAVPDPTTTTPTTPDSPTTTPDGPATTTPTPTTPTTPTGPSTPTTPTTPIVPEPVVALLRLRGVPTTLRASTAIRRGVPVTIALSASGTHVTAELLRPGTRTPLGRLVQQRVSAGTHVLRVTLTKKAARALRGRRTTTVVLRVTATPASAAAVVATKKVTLRG